MYECLKCLVGLLFLFSGLLKLNDVMAFSSKIEGYLQIFILDFSRFFRFLLPYTLLISWVVCLLEVVLGTALLVRWNTIGVVGVLWSLTSFFTLLTLYTFYFKKMASCGCLGEVIVLTPLQSFFKNIFLWILLGIFFLHEPSITYRNPSIGQASGLMIMMLVGIFLAGYGFLRLPLMNWGPYKIGKSIPAMMPSTAAAAYRYWVEKEGQVTVMDTYPADLSYRLVKTELIKKRVNRREVPFAIWDRKKEITKQILEGNKLLVVVAQPIALSAELKRAWQRLVEGLDKRIAIVWLLPFEYEEIILPLPLTFPIIGWGSRALLQSMMPALMGMIWLQEGVIVGKWSYREVKSLQKILFSEGLYKTP